jgi:DNA-binding response OmpR family regulator
MLWVNMTVKRKILLVDDSPIVRAIAVHALTASGFEVAAIDDPRGLEQAVAREAPALILLDATFPGLSDEVLVAAAVKHAAAVPLVVFSDRAQAEIDDLVRRIGARSAVPKDGQTLAARLVALLDASS